MRMTHPTALVLTALASGCRYGFDVMDVTGLPSGTVYPVLRRLDNEGYVRSEWEESEEARERGRPRRRLYRLTGEGRRAVVAAEERLSEARQLLFGPRATEGGGS